MNSNTNVLLLIIPNPSSIILPHSLFYRKFSQYGEVVKILIFEKARVWKCFVEMGDPQQAYQAQLQLNGTQIADSIIMNVYFSTLKNVTFLNNNCGGVDYRQLKLNMNDKKPQNEKSAWNQMAQSQPEITFKQTSTFYLNHSQQQDRQQSYLDQSEEIKQKMPLISDIAKQNYENEWNTDDKLKYGYPENKLKFKRTTLENIINKEQTPLESQKEQFTEKLKTPYDFEKQFTSISTKENIGQRLNTSQNIQEKEIHDNDSNQENEEMSPDGRKIMSAFSSDYIFSIPHLTRSSEQFNQQSQTSLTQQFNQLDIQDFSSILGEQPDRRMSVSCDELFDPTNYVNPQFLIENQPSKVIYIRGLSHPSIQPINLFNLLSNCGNVMVVILIRQKSSALVQFEKLQQAQNAKDHLNNMPFFGQKLKIFYSNYQQIQFPLPYQSPQTLIYIPSRELWRFGEGKSISFNPPSQTLHLSNIKFEVTENEGIIRDLFQGIGSIQAIKFMHINQQKHMALVKLSNLEEAMNGAALLHGKELYGRKINVSFTKSKF